MPTSAVVATHTSSGTSTRASPMPEVELDRHVARGQVGVAQVEHQLADAELVAARAGRHADAGR